MKILFALVALAGILKTGECSIDGWSTPTIATGDGGNGGVTTKMNNGLTTTDATGITIAATPSGVLTVTYSLTSQTPTDVTFALAIDGVLTISAGTLSYATTTEYELIILATDSGSATGSATVTVSVQDQPLFSASSLAYTIADSATAGTTLATVAATKAGAGSLTYSFASGNTNTDFSVSSSGVITNLNVMSASSLAGYKLVLEADDSTLTSTVDIWVAVTTCSSGTTVWIGFTSVFLSLVVSLFLSI